MAERVRSTSAILFDLDGTLINTRRLYFEAYRRALLPNLGRLLTDNDIIALDSRTERRVFEATLPALEITECMQRFYRHYETLHPTHFEGFYPGIPELLQELRERSYSLGIVTGKSRRAWEVTSVAAQLSAFDIVVVEDDVREPKPDPAGLQLALAGLSKDPMEAVYIGDAVHDLRAAHAAGMLGIAALWSKTGERYERLRDAALQVGAVHADHPHDVLALI